MANLAISFNTNGILTAQVILVVRAKSDLMTILFQQAFTANSQHNVTVPDLQPVMHQVEIWDTNDGTTLGALKGQCDADAAQSSGSGSFGYIQFVVDSGIVVGSDTGIAPVDGATQYVDSSLEGLDYIVMKEGFGALQWGRDIQQITGGGFEFINGTVFGNGESYTIITPSTAAATPPAIAAQELTDIILHTADATLSATHRNKLNVFNFAGQVAVLTMETLASVPDKVVYAFSTHQGSQINGEIAFQSGEGVWLNGSLMNKIYLGQNEVIKMQVKGGACYITNDFNGYERLGERVFRDHYNRPNTLPQTGIEYDGTIWKRAFYYIQNILQAGQKVTYTQYDNQVSSNGEMKYNNRGKFAVDGTNFKTPDMQEKYALGKPSGNQSGTWNDWQVGSHWHPTGSETIIGNAALNRSPSHARHNGPPGGTNGTGTDSTDLNAPVGTENLVESVQLCSVIII